MRRQTSEQRKALKARRMLAHAWLYLLYTEGTVAVDDVAIELYRGAENIIRTAQRAVNAERAELNVYGNIIRHRIARHWCTDCSKYRIKVGP